MVVLLFLAALIMSFNGYSSGTYCICKDGVDTATLQKTLDYACGAGADCTAILQNGACYQPNTVKAHCDYAANSYYQRKSQVTGSCDFSGTATISTTPPSTVVAGCTYPASLSQAGTSTTTTTTTGTPTTTTTTGTPSTTSTPGVYGTGTSIAPTGFSDSSSQDFLFCSLSITLTFLFSSLLLFWG